MHTPADGPRLMAAWDQETEQPYYYFEGDAGRRMAQRDCSMDSPVSAPGWTTHDAFASPPPPPQPVEPPPPRREEYALSEAGRQLFRSARAAWYLRHTGRLLLGSWQLVNVLFDLVVRNFRARSDR